MHVHMQVLQVAIELVAIGILLTIQYKIYDCNTELQTHMARWPHYC